MLHEVRLLLSAVQYFTRMRVPAWVGHSAAQLNGSVRYLPLIGTLIGATAAALVVSCSVLWSRPLAVIIAMIASIGMTGGFHEDGLADTFDGLGGSTNRERALEIMKDSRIGAFGALAMLLALLLKWQAILNLPPTLSLGALVAGHSVSRWCAVLVMWRLPYVRSDEVSRAKPLTSAVGVPEIGLATFFGLIPLALCGYNGLWGVAAALLATGLLGRWFSARLGGYTGDTLGATQQLTEIVFYLAMSCAWK